MNRKLLKTEDGSYTLFAEELNEHYHSIHGAYTESIHVFIQSGLFKKLNEQKNTLHILEVGFGTGLNAMLTVRETDNTDRIIYYTALEPFPLDEEIIQELSKSYLPGYHFQTAWFTQMHHAEPGSQIQITNNFYFTRSEQSLEEIIFSDSFDLVYFDAFGPQAQPEIWSFDNFKKIYNAMNKGGVFVTYSSKGSVRRNLTEAGFIVEKISGPPHKREMLRAEKI